MSIENEALDRLSPITDWKPQWTDVLNRAEMRRPVTGRRRRPTFRRGLAAVVIAAAIASPVVAVAAAHDWWWSTKTSGISPAVDEPAVVAEGTWSGSQWVLVAYVSEANELCFSITPKVSIDTGNGAALNCAPMRGVGGEQRADALDATYLSSAATSELPAYIAGAVVGNARTVRIMFIDGLVMRAPVRAGSGDLAGVKFFAVPLPHGTVPRLGFLKSLSGIDASGNVVACLDPMRLTAAPAHCP